MTKNTIQYDAASDGLGWSTPLTNTACFALLGIAVQIRSNSPTVIEIAERAFSIWHSLPSELIESQPPLCIDLLVHPGMDEQPQAPIVTRFYGRTLLAASGASMMTASIDRGEALAFVTPQLVADEATFRYSVLEQLALVLVSHRDRIPLHAGAVVRNGRAVLIAGQSRSGKSTLCYAALRAGFQLLAEDVVYVAQQPHLRIWGNPGAIHLLPDAPRFFPELADAQPQLRANGKLKLVLDAGALGSGYRRLWAEHAVVCLVERRDIPRSTIEPVEPQALVEAIAARPESGFDLHPNLAEVAAAVAAMGVYRLVVGRDPCEAVTHLEHLTGL